MNGTQIYVPATKQYDQRSTQGDHGVGDSNSANEGPFPPIAVVGMAVRLPGNIRTPEALWDLILQKRNSRCPIPKDRYNLAGFHGTSGISGEIGPQHGYFLDEPIDRFDAGFFTMSKAEVAEVDPQQRLLLEVVWECMENGGQKNWKGSKVGCYVGVFGEDWLDLHSKDTQMHGLYRTTGTGDFVLSNRVSYEYDLKGPSMTIRTGCSSALIGLHEACEALYNGQCTSAIVAGTNLIIGPTMTQSMTMQGVLSPSGSCKTFDAAADGYARGEAINAIYIKPLKDALRQGDPIRAVIRATSTNCDGKTNGLSKPSSESHEEMMRMAYSRANLQPFDTAFVECHGTGTPVGDPVETTAVGNVFGKKGIYIGSVKPNVGHSEGASGLTSLIKTVMALENRIIPPNINFSTPNPSIPFAKYGLKVPVNPMPWPSDREERASVNSFGIGGANAHVILDSATLYIRGAYDGRQECERKPSAPLLIPFSANSKMSLERRIAGCRDYATNNQHAMQDLSYTLSMRRDHLPYRTFAIGDAIEELHISDTVKSPYKLPQLNFVFTGQGAQWIGMGKELIEAFPSARSDIRMIDEFLRSLDGNQDCSLEDEICKAPEHSRIELAEISQPLCTALQIVIINLLQKWGISPSAVVGHSSGEIAAAYAAKAISIEAAMTIAYYRGHVTKLQLRPGAMAAVGMSSDEVQEFIKPGVVIACENSSKSVTISGDVNVLDEVTVAITQAKPDVLCRKLRVEKAYHSHHMADVGEHYELLMSKHVTSTSPTIPFYSSVHGKLTYSSESLDSSYWRFNLEKPVRFRSAVNAILHEELKPHIFLEIGPHAALAGPLRQIFQENDLSVTPVYLPTLVRNEDQVKCMLRAAGSLFQHGQNIDFSAINGTGKILTNLPPYPWEHDTGYWRESRVSRDWRLRKYSQHELLGSRVIESTEIEPSWRNVLELKDVPWLQDHKVGEDIVFPAAGYIAMIGEAIRQVTESSSYSVRRLVVSNALVITEPHQLELVTTCKPSKLTDTLDSDWYEFTIVSYNDKSWTRHCTGQARANSALPVSPLSTKKFPRVVESKYWYSVLKDLGLNYGPRFQALTNIRSNPVQNVATASTSNPTFIGRDAYCVHPIVIDQVLQLFTVAMSNGLSRNLLTLAIPSYIGEIQIGEGGQKFDIEAEAIMSSKGTAYGNASASSNGHTIITLKEGKFSAIGDSDTEARRQNAIAATRLEWRPDINFATETDLIEIPDNKHPSVLLIEKVALLTLIETWHDLKDIQSNIDHLNRYHKWVDMEIARIADDYHKEIIPEAKGWLELSHQQRRDLLDTMIANPKDTSFFDMIPIIRKVFNNCIPMMQGKADALDILMEDDSLATLYNFCQDVVDIKPFFRLSGHARPTMRILEIGAGTGGITSQVLQALHTPESTLMYSEYCYTDISAGFFPGAQKKFKDYGGMKYSVLDITKDPFSQGFEAQSFDMIIASNVLHATPVLQETLTHVRRLLAPGGRLFLQELSIRMRWINYIMGVLPGWWLGVDDDRENEPFVTPDRWDQELRKSGFSGVDTLVYDDEEPYQINAHIISSAKGPETPFIKSVGLLYYNKICKEARRIADHLSLKGFEVSWHTLDQTPPRHGKMIALLDLEEPFLYRISKSSFDALQNFLSSCDQQGASIIWVTKPAQMNCKDPRYGLVPGFSRSIRSELSLDFATFETDQLGDAFFEALADLCKRFPEDKRSADMNQDYEYAFSDGQVYTSRFHWISSGIEHDKNEGTGPLHLSISSYGSLDSLAWVQFDSKVEFVADEVEVEMRSVGLNFRDVLIVMGIVDTSDDVLGLEGSGIVRRVGPEVHDLSVGDRVLVCDGGCFSTTMITSNRLCVKIPDTLGFEDAATIPIVFSTVTCALIEIGRLEKSQSVLIHSACGGVGLAAIQICQMIGAEIFATVGSEEKVKYLEDTFHIPRSHIFNSRNATFLPDLMRETNGKGADLVLNSLSGELLHASWQCVAKYGKMLEIGKRDFIGHGMLSMDMFQANRSFCGVNLFDLRDEKPDYCHKLLQDCLSYYAQGHIQPIQRPRTFQAAQISEAFRYMQQGQHIGKIAINMPESLKDIPVLPRTHKAKFRSHSSYLLIGGLGGLGRAVSTWMAENGARNFVYLSRSAGNSSDDKSFIEELESQGCMVKTVQGTVDSPIDIARTIGIAPKPIVGIIQMSMVLRDGNFLNMDYSDWEAPLSTKVEGTWNLHNAFRETDLDFFLLFSSISGIAGQWGQSNYAAANTFLDSFVQFRHSHGLPASVIDVGVVEDIGFVSKNASILDLARNSSTQMIREPDLISAISMAIMRSQPCVRKAGEYCNRSQVTIGLSSTRSLDDPVNRCAWKRDIRMALYRNRQATQDDGPSNPDVGLKELIQGMVMSPESTENKENMDLLISKIGERIKSLIFSSEEELDPTRRLADLGVDSLIAIEIRNWLKRMLGLEVTVLEIMGEGTIERLAHLGIAGLKAKHLEKHEVTPQLSMEAP